MIRKRCLVGEAYPAEENLILCGDSGTRSVLFIHPKLMCRWRSRQGLLFGANFEEVQEVKGNLTKSVGIL